MLRAMFGLIHLLRRPLGGWLLSALLLLLQQGAWQHAFEHARAGLPGQAGATADASAAAVGPGDAGRTVNGHGAASADGCVLCLAFGACTALLGTALAWRFFLPRHDERHVRAWRLVWATQLEGYLSRAPPLQAAAA